MMDFGKSVVIKGELSGSEDLTVSGRLEGHIKLPDHTLTIAAAANIQADIFAKAVVILGAVTGEVTAGETVTIGATGSVTGGITTPRLALADGGILLGRVEMSPRVAGHIP